jgi:predicted nucleic acid-binding protein
MPGTDLYYWDSCLFLAWLRNETRADGEMAAVRSYVRKLQQRQIRLMASVLVYTEVVETKLPVGVDKQFFELLRRSNVSTVSVDIRVAQLARELRDYYYKQKDKYNGKTLSVPDSIHLATAILYKAKEFHTFDGSNKKSLGLLGLNGDVGGHDLIICKPQDTQGELDFD